MLLQGESVLSRLSICAKNGACLLHLHFVLCPRRGRGAWIALVYQCQSIFSFF